MPKEFRKPKPAVMALIVSGASALLLGGLMMSRDFRWNVCKFSAYQVCINVDSDYGCGARLTRMILKARGHRSSSQRPDDEARFFKSMKVQ